jgi:hypothetical protein
MFITREELYRLVSERPLSKLAPELGLSASALARVCQTYSVPYPGSGYWTKKAMGLPVQIAPLPRLGQDGERIDLATSKAPALTRNSPQRPTDLDQKKLPAALSERVVHVNERLTKPHSLISKWLLDHEDRTRKAAQSRDPWQMRLAPVPRTALDRRRHRILDAIFKAVEAGGGEITEGPKGLIRATISGEKIDFQVREKSRQVKIPKDDKRSSYLSMELVGTGSLVFAIRTYLRGPHNEEWKETERRPLEAQIPQIVNRLFEGAEILKAWRKERDAEGERWRLEREKRAEIERQRLLDEARKTELMKLAERWEAAQRLKSYLTNLASAQPPMDAVVGDKTVRDWFDWADAVVAELNEQAGSAVSAFSWVNSTRANS